MKYYNAKDIRNIAVAGHAGRGKTTLVEAMLYIAGLTDRLGRVDDGTAVLDFDPEERRRNVSVSAAVAPIEWKDCKLNIIDTPGLFDFEGEMCEGIAASECVLIVLGAGHKYDVGAEKAFKAAKKRGKMFAITRCDKEHADFYKTFEEIKAVHGGAVCPVIVPYIVDGQVKAYVNLAARKGYEYHDGKAVEIPMPDDPKIQEMLDILTEAVATASDELMEKFFAGEEFTRKEIIKALNDGVNTSSVYPVYACSGYTTDGVDLLMDELAYSAPDAASYAGGKDVECDENGPLAALCFKTVADPFVGKMSYFKVDSGKITPETPVYNARTGETERMGKIITIRGNKSEDCKCIPAGDIGVGGREVGYMFGQYKRLTNSFQGGMLTGKGLTFGGSLARTEATGYGLCYFTAEALKCMRNDSLEGKTVVISGSGNVAIYACEKATQLGAKVVTMSDSNGYVYDPNGIDLAYVKDLKEVRRGRIKEYAETHEGVTYVADCTKVWTVPCDIALPCATQNEINKESAEALVKGGCTVVCEGANMPSTPEAIEVYLSNGILYGPAKASNAGGVATSGLEMSQNSERLSWTFEEVDAKLKGIMEGIFHASYDASVAAGSEGNLMVGANCAGFLKVATAMMAQGITY